MALLRTANTDQTIQKAGPYMPINLLLQVIVKNRQGDLSPWVTLGRVLYIYSYTFTGGDQ